MTDTLAAEETAVDAVLSAHPDKVQQAKSEPALLGWFVGQVMRECQGRANPHRVEYLLRSRLEVPDEP